MNLLMHMCCGPCSCYPLKKLREEGIEPTGYFFNPNIHPYTEWDQRLQNAEKFAAMSHMDFVADREYRIPDFLKSPAGREYETGALPYVLHVATGECRALCGGTRL